MRKIDIEQGNSGRFIWEMPETLQYLFDKFLDEKRNDLASLGYTVEATRDALVDDITIMIRKFLNLVELATLHTPISFQMYIKINEFIDTLTEQTRADIAEKRPKLGLLRS